MNLKRSLALALTVMMLLGVALPAAFGAGETLERIAGSNRWATAVEISKEGWTSAGTVVLANGMNYPDALAGVSLAHSLNAPILLTQPTSLVAEAKAEIIRLGAAKVIILGGTGVISAAVATELEGMGLTVERISGDDRFETAAAVAKKLAPSGVDTVVLAYGRGFADALAAASYAAVNGYPILLTERNSCPEATKKAIEDLGATKVLVIGGTGVIADSALTGLPGVERIFGSNREATSVELAKRFAPNANKFFIATGDGFADAITGAVLAAKEGTGILLVRSSFPAVVGNFFQDKNVSNAVIFGGTTVVSANIATAAAGKLVQHPSGVAGFVSGSSKDAVVTIDGRSGVVGEDGFYYVAGVSPGKHTLTVSKPGFAINPYQNVVVASNKITVKDLGMGADLTGGAVKISGLVYDSTTLGPVAAVIDVYGYNKDNGKWEVVKSGTTNVDGTFSVEDAALKLNTEYRVTVSRALSDTIKTDVYEAMTKTIKTDAYKSANVIAEPFALRPVKSMVLSGTAIDKENAKVPVDTPVILKSGNTTIATALVDSEGAFKFAKMTLPTGTYTVEATLASNAIYSASVAITEGVDRVHNVKLVAGYNVTFDLGVDPLDAVFAAGDYTAQLYQGDVKVGLPDTVTLAAPANIIDFDFSAQLIPAGTYTLKVAGDYIVAKSFNISVADNRFSFNGRTALAGIFTGDVTDTDTPANDIEKATVRLLTLTGAEVAKTETAADGSYSFVGVPAGKYKVEASKGGYGTKTSAEVQVTVKGSVTVADIQIPALPTEGGLTGYIRTNGTMEPAVNVDVTLYAVSVDGYDAGDYVTNFGVAADGKYTVEGLKPGKYTLVIRDEGAHENYVETITIAAGNPVTKHFLLTVGGEASLEVKTVKDKRGATVAVTSDFTLTDAFGETYDHATKIVDLPAGTYTLTFDTAAGYLSYSGTVTIAKNQERELNLIVEDCWDVNVTVYGSVFPGSPLSDALVRVFNSAGQMVDSGVTVAGVKSFDLATGSYTFKVYKDGYFAAEFTQSITKDTNCAILYLELVQ